MSDIIKSLSPIAGIFQQISLILMTLVAITLVAVTCGSALSYLPWLSLSAGFGEQEIANAGMYLQLFFTALSVMLLFFLPGHGRMMRLENSHRKFHLSMQDVARAYRLAHEADREGLFKTGAEFDAVRERIAHLRTHPDLAGLEPEILEIAAQMSFESRDLARVYSDERVERARNFLRQRHEEMEEYRGNLKMARQSVDELKHWLTQVEADELVISKQVDTLETDLNALLPKLGFEVLETPDIERTVVPLSSNPRRDRSAVERRKDPRNDARIKGKSTTPSRNSGSSHRSTTRGPQAAHQNEDLGQDQEL